MRRYFSIILLCAVCATKGLVAQTASVARDSVLREEADVHWLDTIKLYEQPEAVSDTWLLDLIQHAQTASADTAALVLAADSVGYIMVDTITGDTLWTVAQVLARDSIRREMALIDSLKAVNASLCEQVHEVPTLHVQRSLVKDAEEDQRDAMRAIRNMRTPWRKEAKIIAQMTQNYVSPNWYQGGTSSFAVLSIMKGEIGYYGERLTWENTGEWRAGGSTAKEDTLRNIACTDDLFRVYSKLNYRAVHKLFYSFSAEVETRFFKTYTPNTMTLKSAPFSPVRLNLALGLDYKPVDGLSLSFSPLAYKMIHVMDTVKMNAADFGIEAGKRTLNDVGSSIRLEYVWKPVREVVLETKFYMYTNYKRVEMDLEVNCDFIINRFFSARVMLHPRYDNTVVLDGDEKAKVQFKELLSIGFAHKFR